MGICAIFIGPVRNVSSIGRVRGLFRVKIIGLGCAIFIESPKGVKFLLAGSGGRRAVEYVGGYKKTAADSPHLLKPPKYNQGLIVI